MLMYTCFLPDTVKPLVSTFLECTLNALMHCWISWVRANIYTDLHLLIDPLPCKRWMSSAVIRQSCCRGNEKINTCLKKLDTVTVTGRKLPKLSPVSSVVDDQLPLLSCTPVVQRRSREPRLDQEPEPDSVPPLRRNWSKLLVLLLRSNPNK